MSINLFEMLNPSEGMFSEESSPKRRQTITHPDFPEIKNGMDAVRFIIEWWNYNEGVYTSLLHEDEWEKTFVSEPASKYGVQHRLAESGFGEIPLNSISSYLSRLHGEGEISRVRMKDHLNGDKTQSMYCANEDLEDIEQFHWKFSRLLNSMSEGQLQNFCLNHEAGRFIQDAQQ